MILGTFDVVVIGAGHAGIEAAVASARLGCQTALFTLTLDGVGNMPCNPAIGGTAKGHLVREIDALGGVMAIAADATSLQTRMLNLGKGPAVHSLRVQSDRQKYHIYMKKLVETEPNLYLKQAEICEILFDENRRVTGVITQLGTQYNCKAVIIATGTYLTGKIYVGDAAYYSGPDGHHSARALSDSLKANGIKLRRFKTGTPARVNKRSIDFSQMEIQEGDPKPVPMSFMTRTPVKNVLPCYINYTNEETHEVIRRNIHRSPLYGGKIEGIGPRYCPSLEDKVMRFSEKPRHQFFVEPCGYDTDEMYLQGLSSSLPEEVQVEFYKTIKGLENLQVQRPAYAIEYDCVDPLELQATLEFKDYPFLYGAGQFNGTSGYEEAAAQGLIAGINAARKVQGKSPFTLSRQSSYIGTLIDDLITKGVMDPYRMMTSRSEYRLYLRQDNADERLTPMGREIGLVSDERWRYFNECIEAKDREIERLSKTTLHPAQINDLLEKKGYETVKDGVRASEFLKRPRITYDEVVRIIGEGENVSPFVAEKVEVYIKYDGYVKRQQLQIEKVKRLEATIIPDDIDYMAMEGIRLEAREKLAKIRPANVGQASRISGVNPADISSLLLELKIGKMRKEKDDR
ncbi:MAG: tRNA uridine-5-carboxymethylaminomethyl(34) synthesis enzyme MnmG [Oscillospiraceae bacterium]|nr:tRNA uridine-5-carboxymethylaminomethyl(34) synthesis enzyme MnmG [Oscillospiraceae bacterium]